MTWNDFLWPLVTLDPDNPTVQVSLSTLASGYYQRLLAGPRRHRCSRPCRCSSLFFVVGRQIIGGIMEGAVKG